MAKLKLTGQKIRKMIDLDNATKLKRERLHFFAWWQSQFHRDQISPQEAAWRGWRERAGIKAPLP